MIVEADKETGLLILIVKCLASGGIFMKTILFIFCLFAIACVTSGPKARSVASTECNINNYRDIVFQYNAEPPQCNLQNAKLRDANLQGADLRFADLRNADLRRANLQEANLRGADLRGAMLWGVWHNGKPLWHAKLRGADLTGAKVTCYQAEYLKSNYGGYGFTELNSPSWLACFFDW